MRSLLSIVVIMSLPLFSFSQNKVAVVSAYSFPIDESESDVTSDLTKFLLKDDLIVDIMNKRLPDIISELNGFLTLNDGKHLEESFYKNVLEDFEAAPDDLNWAPGGIYSAGEKPKTDYKFTENQIMGLDGYLAIGTFKPFNNEEAVKTLFEKMPDVSGLMFIEIFPSASFSGSAYGVGDAKGNIAFKVKILNKKMKTVLSSGLIGVVGKSTTVIPVAVRDTEFDKTVVEKAYNEAIDNLISKLEGKLKKKASKIKW